jgi:hypothetical protein
LEKTNHLTLFVSVFFSPTLWLLLNLLPKNPLDLSKSVLLTVMVVRINNETILNWKKIEMLKILLYFSVLGGGSLGHPKIYINLDKPGPHACTYCK